MVAYTNYLTDARPRRESESLVQRGDDVHFIALGEPHAPHKEIVKGVQVYRVSLFRYRGGSSVQYILSYLKFFLLTSWKLLELSSKNKFDVVYVHTMPDFMVFTALIPKLFGSKIVLDMHDMMPEIYQSKFGISENHFLIRLIKFQERLSCAFANNVVCVTEPQKNVLVNRGVPAEKIFVLLNLPDPTIFGSRNIDFETENTQPLRIIFHGTIAERLGLDIALRAFQEVVQKIPDAKFDIYGDGDFSDNVVRLIEELGLKQNVNFRKKFFRVEDVPSLVQGATIGIIPNRKDVATEYMLPVKLLEYVYLGIPVIAPPLLVIRYYFDESMVAYIPAENHSAIAGAMVRLFSDKEERIRLCKNAQKFFNTFSWEKMKFVLYKIIDE